MNTSYRTRHHGAESWRAAVVRIAQRGFVVAISLAFAACALIRVETQWSNPNFPDYRIKGKVLVVGVSRDATLRRLYEDEMSAQLLARGVESEHSYDSVLGPLSLDGNRPILLAAKRAGAGAILSSAVVDREVSERVIAEPIGGPDLFYDRWYGHYWPYVHAHTEVRVTERFIISTSLTDVATGKVVWTARSYAESSENAEAQITALAKAITEALARKNIL